MAWHGVAWLNRDEHSIEKLILRQVLANCICMEILDKRNACIRFSFGVSYYCAVKAGHRESRLVVVTFDVTLTKRQLIFRMAIDALITLICYNGEGVV